MDIEWALICKAVEVGGYQQLAMAHITEAYFQDPDNAAAFGWMRDHWNTYEVPPGEEAFRHEYPEDNLIETPEPLAYYIDELRAQREYALVTAMLDQIKEPLKNGDSSIALKIMATGIENIHTEVVHLLDDHASEWKKRMSRYELLTEHQGGLLGPPTGFQTMDIATGGLQDQQLITLIGLPKVGKSMILMCMNIAANQAGKRTMYASFEMTNDEQFLRHDALRAGVSLSRLSRGQLVDTEWAKLRRMFHASEDMADMTLVHDPAGVTTVSAIASKISEVRPDIVFIDGSYLMDTENPAITPGTPQALTEMTRSLKRLAQRFDIPIVQTTQALSWKARGGKLSLDSIGYSSSFAQDSDVIFGVEEVKERPDLLNLRIVASRNSPRREVTLVVDLDHGSVLETEDITYDSDDEGI